MKRGIGNEFFCSYLKKRKQFVSKEINMSSLKEILKKSVLGPLLFLIYINDPPKSIRFSKKYHFVDLMTQGSYNPTHRLKNYQSK